MRTPLPSRRGRAGVGVNMRVPRSGRSSYRSPGAHPYPPVSRTIRGSIQCAAGFVRSRACW